MDVGDDEESEESETEEALDNGPRSEVNEKHSDSEGSEDDPELRRRLAEALKTRDLQADSDEGLEEEEEMDDEQLMAIDHQLTAIFKERAEGKTRGKQLFSYFSICSLMIIAGENEQR